MNIHTLRHIDIWVGRPICWILTIVFKIKRFFIKKEQIKNPNNILFIKLLGLGSIVLTIPSINAVKRKYPNSSIFFLTFKGNEEILILTEGIKSQNIYTVRSDNFINLLLDVVKCLAYLVRERIDVVIDLEFFSRFTAILSFFIRSKYRIGFYGFHTEGLKRGSFINFPINYNHTLHTSRAFFTLLKPLGIKKDEYDPTVPNVSPSDGFKDKIVTKIRQANDTCNPDATKQWVIINPNTSELIEQRMWPAKHFIRLVELLLDRFKSLGIIFIGAKGERPYVESLCKPLVTGQKTNRVVNLAGMTTIRDLSDLLHFSTLFITNDSGPAHLASLTETPTIVLFGPETPDLYFPLGKHSKSLYLGLDCQPCVTVFNGKHSYCKDNVCLQQIKPESVIEIATELLMANYSARPMVKPKLI